jgi:putative hemolysin
MTDLPSVLVILILVVLSGLFSLAETALTASRKSKLKTKALENRGYAKALKAAEHPDSALFTIRWWISLLRITAGVWGGAKAASCLASFAPASPVWRWWFPLVYYGLPLLISGIVTAAAVLLGELVPRQIALLAPEKIAARTLPLVVVLGFPLRPLMALSSLGSGLFSRLFHIDAAKTGITEDEIRAALAEGEKSGIVESEERTMVEGVFYLGDRPVGTFMTHRSDIEWLDINAGREEARKAAVQFRNQVYFPVASGSLDAVAGILSVQDILIALTEPSWPGIKAIMQPPSFIPETMSALKAFEAFKRGEANFLCVMDEYGGFAGTLSVKDLVEEIIGELSGDPSGKGGILRREDGAVLAEGSVNIDEIAKVLPASDLPGEHQEYHTLAGFILELAGEIPKPGAVFEWRSFRFKIAQMDGNRIDKVLIYPPREEAPASSPEGT